MLPTSTTQTITTRTRTLPSTQFQSQDMRALPLDLMPKILTGNRRLQDFQSLACASRAWFNTCKPLLGTIRKLATKDAKKREPHLSAITVSRTDAKRLAVQYVEGRLQNRKKNGIGPREIVKMSNAFLRLGPSKDEIATSFLNLRGLSLKDWNGMIKTLHVRIYTKLALMMLCYHPRANMFLDQEDLLTAKRLSECFAAEVLNQHRTANDMAGAICRFKSEDNRNAILFSWWALACEGYVNGDAAPLLDVHDARWMTTDVNGKIAWLNHCFQTKPDSLALLDRLCQDAIGLAASLGESAQSKNQPAVDPLYIQALLELLTACIETQWTSRHINSRTDRNIPGFVNFIELIAQHSSKLLRLASGSPAHLTAFVQTFSSQTEKRLSHLKSYEDLLSKSAEVSRLKLAIKTMKKAASAGGYWSPEDFKKTVWQGR